MEMLCSFPNLIQCVIFILTVITALSLVLIVIQNYWTWQGHGNAGCQKYGSGTPRTCSWHPKPVHSYGGWWGINIWILEAFYSIKLSLGSLFLGPPGVWVSDWESDPERTLSWTDSSHVLVPPLSLSSCHSCISDSVFPSRAAQVPPSSRSHLLLSPDHGNPPTLWFQVSHILCAINLQKFRL